MSATFSTVPPNRAATILWFRADLRLADNAALTAAIDRGGPVIPVYLWAPEDEGAWAPGAASRLWLHHSLEQLDAALRARGSRLILRTGAAHETLADLASSCNAAAVVWTRRIEPQATATSRSVATALTRLGLDASEVPANLLAEPEAVRTKERGAYQVFTPFWNALQAVPGGIGPATRAPRSIPAPERWPRSEELHSLGLLPQHTWASTLHKAWSPGESGARAALLRFARGRASGYAPARDFPASPGTSRLSPHLHFGEISARQAWHATDSIAFRRQLAWRDFAHHLLHHFPSTATQPLRAPFTRFPWRRDAEALRAWQRGRTGYPVVDAAMRELWHTGWMHNRARMIVASFLVKHLLVRWQDGAAWFWDTLVDADLANNTLGWQWTAGCGADAAPYFRVFNPVLQGQKFDGGGSYVRQWVPELARLPDSVIHRPWEATPIDLAAAGVELGVTYPRPIVDHAAARERALRAYDAVRANHHAL